MTRFSYSRRALRRASRDDTVTLAAVERLAAGKEPLAVDPWHGRDAQGAALTAPYGRPLVERNLLGGLQVGPEKRPRPEMGRDRDTHQGATGCS
ncbi:hypothetical protein GCM10010424_71160 [Streptomyces lienomycini]